MDDWREMASAGQWAKILLGEMTDEERQELAEIVSCHVPKVRMGDGTEVIEDFIPPHLARTQREEEAAQLLLDLRGWVVFAKSGPQNIRLMSHREAREITRSLLIPDAINLALETLDEAGIYLEWSDTDWRGLRWPDGDWTLPLECPEGKFYGGLRGTYIYTDGDGEWHTLRPDIAAALDEKRSRLFSELNHNAFEEWCDRYPWRRCAPLYWVSRLGNLGFNTPEDHAIRFFECIWHLCCQDAWSQSRMDPDSALSCDTERNEEDIYAYELADGLSIDTDLSASSIARNAFAAGVHFEALRKKSVEYEAVKARKDAENRRRNGAKGGQASKKQERYDALNNLARKNLSRLQFVSDMQALRIARKLAAEHDLEAVAPLFQMNGKPMSDDWFSEWLSAFRADMSQIVDKAR